MTFHERRTDTPLTSVLAPPGSPIVRVKGLVPDQAPGTGPTALTRLKLKLKLLKTKKGRRVTVTVKANGRPAKGALVRVFAKGVTPFKAKTNRFGKVTFRLKKLGRGKRLMRRQLLFHAAKTGFLPASAVFKVRY